MHKQSHTIRIKVGYGRWQPELILCLMLLLMLGSGAGFVTPQPLNRPETSLARDGALLVKGGNKSLPSFSQYSEKAWQLC